MAKKKSLEDKYFPVETVPKLNQPAKPPENPAVIKRIIRAAVQAAYNAKTPSAYDDERGYAHPVAKEDIEFVSYLIESFQPADCIEAALASQFAISYIRGLTNGQCSYSSSLQTSLHFFEFGHQVIETLTKYRTKGAQLINVQYNHNQGQINNINLNKGDDQKSTIEVC